MRRDFITGLRWAARLARTLSVEGSAGDPNRIASLLRDEGEGPRTLSSMTGLYLPQILRDYPNFNWPQLRERAGRAVLAALRQEETGLCPQDEALRAQIAAARCRDREQGLCRRAEALTVHGVEMVRYAPGQSIVLQAAAGGRLWTERGGRVVSGSREHIRQIKVSLELLCLQDPAGADGAAVSLHCPNCGAPLRPDQRTCAYCGGAAEALNARLWGFGRFKILHF